MSQPLIDRLEALKGSYITARDCEPAAQPEKWFSKGMRAGLQIAIDGIDSEIRIIRAGMAAQTNNQEAGKTT